MTSHPPGPRQRPARRRRLSRRVSSDLVPALLCLLTIGCDSSPAQSSRDDATASGAGGTAADYSATDHDFAAIHRLLKQRARALTTHDRTAFLATVDPTNDGFVAQQQTYYDNLKALPVSTITYEMDDYALTPADVPGDDPLLRPDVTENVFMKSIDAAPVGNELDDTFVRRNGRWLLGAESDSSFTYEGGVAASRPWGGGPIAVRVRGQVVVVTDTSDGGLIDELAGEVARDLHEIATVMDRPAVAGVLVDATSVGDPVRVSDLGHLDAAAVTYPAVALKHSQATRVAGWRIKINPQLTRELMLDREVLRHELTHFVLHAINRCTPTWLAEGAAEYASHAPTPVDQQELGPASYSFVLGSLHALPSSGLWANDPTRNYTIARGAVTYLATRYGVPRLISLMKAYSACDTRDYTGDSNTATLLAQTYGISPAQLARGASTVLSRMHH